ncbi:MAG: cobalamin-dependent protein [Alphaproteobacteria bacterium]|nr:cobalamin-dependent protein [Alphaproteobacteria bacterium]
MPALKDHLLRSSQARQGAPACMLSAKRAIRVLLIQPPTAHGVASLLPHVDNEGENEGIGHKPPLGLLYVATTVKERSNHQVRVIDAQAENLTFEQVVARAVDFRPDIIGLSVWTDFWYPCWHQAELLKEALPQAHLTMGGPHLGIYPQETLDQPFVDSVVAGDGEIPFLYLCNMIANGVEDNSMQGLHFKKGGVKGGDGTLYIHGDLDDLPIPDRTLLPIGHYGSVMAKGAFVTTMITSRGCPHRCTFCKLSFQKNLARSAGSVIEEFRRIKALGIGEVEIYDDTFTWSKKRLEEICNGLIDADLGVEWAARDRVSSAAIDLDTLKLMRKAGCTRIHYGVESGVQRVIDRMKKRITLDQARKAVDLAKKAKITVLTYFMFGNLDETIEDMQATIDFSLTLNADFAQFSVTIPYAGTEMYEEALTSGLIDSDYWGDYARHPMPNFLPPKLIESHADKAALIALRNDAVRRFYFRPRFIMKELLSLRSFKEFQRKASMGLQLLQSVYRK